MRCALCPHRCALKEGGPPGRGRVRALRDGVNLPRNYGLLTAAALDPIEKKPLKRFMPGSTILSVGSFGCNMACYFCQNEHIATADLDTAYSQHVSPERLVDMALAQKPRGNIGVAFTYNEPLVGYEYVRDTARLARAHGLETVVVTNGQIEEEALSELLPLISAWNIDLKAFSQQTYGRLGGRLDVTLRTIRLAAEAAHVEVTTLLVPGLSDDEEEMRQEAAFLASIDPGLPLHLSRYFPCYQFDAPATPKETMIRLQGIARQSLERVILGNLG